MRANVMDTVGVRYTHNSASEACVVVQPPRRIDETPLSAGEWSAVTVAFVGSMKI
jgi:hypothetical protein